MKIESEIDPRAAAAIARYEKQVERMCADHFHTILARLARAGCLFRNNEEKSAHLPLDELLPFNEVTKPFHAYFVNFCIENDIPNVLVVYLQNYKILENFESLKSLMESDSLNAALYRKFNVTPT